MATTRRSSSSSTGSWVIRLSPPGTGFRFSCALGALLSSLMTVGELGDLSLETYGDLLREAITDLLEPRDIARRRLG